MASTAVDKQTRILHEPDPGHFSLIRAYHLADFITLMNGFCGFNSIISSLRYCINPRDKSSLWMALAFMPFGLFFDFFDGKVARWRKKSSLMGQELDSLADLVSPVFPTTDARLSDRNHRYPSALLRPRVPSLSASELHLINYSSQVSCCQV